MWGRIFELFSIVCLIAACTGRTDYIFLMCVTGFFGFMLVESSYSENNQNTDDDE